MFGKELLIVYHYGSQIEGCIVSAPNRMLYGCNLTVGKGDKLTKLLVH